jgi:magnesium chelatase accessory protein
MTELSLSEMSRRSDPLGKPIWSMDGVDWPNRAASRFVTAGGLRWHVQIMGSGPALLLLHGTGAATHSWRDLAPLLATSFTVIAPDLPGHGFTDTPSPDGLSLTGMARSIAALLKQLDIEIEIGAGHSAGAAILTRMSLDQLIKPTRIFSLNGALLPLGGVPGQIFAPVARLIGGSTLVPRLFAWHAGDRSVVEHLLRDTGSRIDPQGVALYQRLIRRPGHVAAALNMMAHWDLHALARDLPALRPRLDLIVGGNDRTIKPRDASRVRQILPSATLTLLPGLGHLAHEEAPATIAALIGDTP